MAAEVRTDYLRDQAAMIAALRNRNPDLAGALMRKSMTRKAAPRLSLLPVEV
jgi:hypothetical protein